MRVHTTLAFDTTRRGFAFALAALSLSACGTTATPADAASTDAVTDSPAGDASASDAVIGSFQVKLVAPTDASAGYTSVVGRVQDGPTPAAIVWEQAATEGDCRLLTPRVPFCATPCGGSAVCVENDTCRPYPTAQVVGAVTVTGVRTSDGATSFVMNPIANTYQPTGVMLPFPAFAAGDAIRFDAAGSAWMTAFSVSARGVSPLSLTTSPVRIQTGQALELAWTAPAAPTERVAVRLDISHHGGTRGKIECDTADDGSLTIASTLLTRLVSLGVAGYPTIVVTRVARGATPIRAGVVELNVSSEVETPVEIPNLRSCTSNADCDGGTCRADLTCG